MYNILLSGAQLKVGVAQISLNTFVSITGRPVPAHGASEPGAHLSNRHTSEGAAIKKIQELKDEQLQS